MYKVRIGDDVEFHCGASQTILNAALSASVPIRYSCRDGRCGECQAVLIAGSGLGSNDSTVSTGDVIPTCDFVPRSDIELGPEVLSTMRTIPPRILPCKISKMERVTSDILKIRFRFPPNANFSFMPGQYLNLINGSVRRSYSIASPSTLIDSNEFELLVRKYPGGRMSSFLFDEAKEGDLLRIEGPFGSFDLSSCASKKVLFVATGVGIAPFISLLEESDFLPSETTIDVIWGGRCFSDIFIDLSAYPPVSQLGCCYSREGEKPSYVQEIVPSFLKSKEYDAVFACGNPTMIEEVRNLVAYFGYPREHFYADPFLRSES